MVLGGGGEMAESAVVFLSLSRFPHLEHKVSHGTSCTAGTSCTVLPLRKEPRGHMKQKCEVSKEKEREARVCVCVCVSKRHEGVFVSAAF